MATKGYFSQYVFLHICKHLLSAGDSFAGAQSTDSAMLSLRHETFFTNGALICNVLFSKLWRNSSVSCQLGMCTALPRSNLHISVFHKCTRHPKVASVSSPTKASATLVKSESPRCLLFHEWQNPALLRDYPYFPNTLLIFMIFRNKYGRAVTVGMYVNELRPWPAGQCEH